MPMWLVPPTGGVLPGQVPCPAACALPGGQGRSRASISHAGRRRFHTLGDKVSRRDVLARGWFQVRRNNGVAGIDHVTLADVKEYSVARLLDEVASDLREGRYRPLPARRAFIPKPGDPAQHNSGRCRFRWSATVS